MGGDGLSAEHRRSESSSRHVFDWIVIVIGVKTKDWDWEERH